MRTAVSCAELQLIGTAAKRMTAENLTAVLEYLVLQTSEVCEVVLLQCWKVETVHA